MAPQTHPQAQFVPISPDFDLDALVNSTDNFDYVTRLSTEKLQEHSIQSFEALVLTIVIQTGKPLVIENWDSSLPPWLFSRGWLEENLGKERESLAPKDFRSLADHRNPQLKVFVIYRMRRTSP